MILTSQKSLILTPPTPKLRTVGYSEKTRMPPFLVWRTKLPNPIWKPCTFNQCPFTRRG